jgi:homoserine kinase
VFSICKGIDTATKVKNTIEHVYMDLGIDFDMHISKINTTGVKIIE